MAAFPAESARFDNIANKAERNINVYIKTKATVAFGQAVIAGIALTLFDIPGAFIWAFLVFLLDFIPYLGALLSFIPPVILAFIILEPAGFLAVVFILVANQQVWGSIVEPQLAGQRLDMSPIVLLALVAFWYWAWGLTGMILGVPLAVIMKILLESDERTLPIAIMLSRNPPSSVDNNDQVSIGRDSE
jgi:predicted PurR-regulated permease PerM